MLPMNIVIIINNNNNNNADDNSRRVVDRSVQPSSRRAALA